MRPAINDPARLTSSKKVMPWVELTSSRNQSDERDISGGSTKAGDVNLRRALCQAATVMMHLGRATWLRTWAAQVARRRGADFCRSRSSTPISWLHRNCIETAPCWQP
ncbi:MAG: transposase [Paracoccaceae bacterium]